MERVGEVAALRAAVAAARGAGRRVGFVPTMGYLHEGHLSLLDLAATASDYIVASIFVNPLQFGPGEDYARYPRDVERDARLLEARGASLVFTPDVETLYPGGEPDVRVVPGPLADRLCGAFRPGHFEGVLTVVAKLFNLVRPDVAVFGQKDFQQAVLIRRMVRDLNFPVEIRVGPIAREPDGLALSSRNSYLTKSERERAAALSRGLERARARFEAGERDAARLRDVARAALEEAGLQPQYVELVEASTLRAVERAEPGHVLALAAYVGATRLIDNVVLGSDRGGA